MLNLEAADTDVETDSLKLIFSDAEGHDVVVVNVEKSMNERIRMAKMIAPKNVYTLREARPIIEKKLMEEAAEEL